MSSAACADRDGTAFALVDCNNFYVSCERVFCPELAGQPVVVLSNNDACIVARSEEAKVIGLPMGGPIFRCRDLCRQHRVRIFSSNYPLYGDMSRRVVEVLRQFAPAVEVYSIDEVFLDFADLQVQRRRRETGRAIRRTVDRWTGIPVCVGLAPTKTLAKLANRLAKRRPEAEGVFDLTDPERRAEVLRQVEVKQIWGIGPRYRDRLAHHGIRTAHQLVQTPDARIRKLLTVTGLRLVWELRGVSCLSLEQVPAPRKAIARSRGFGRSLATLDELREPVAAHTASAARVLRKQGSVAGCLQVHLETSRFTGPYRGNAATARLPMPTASTPELVRVAHLGLERIFKSGYRYLRAGVLLTDVRPQDIPQLDLFGAPPYGGRQKVLMEVMDQINTRWGKGTLRLAAEGVQQKWRMRQARLSPRYTTCWEELPVVGAREIEK